MLVLLSFHGFYFLKVYFVSQSLDIFFANFDNDFAENILSAKLAKTHTQMFSLARKFESSLCDFVEILFSFRKWEGEGRGFCF